MKLKSADSTSVLGLVVFGVVAAAVGCGSKNFNASDAPQNQPQMIASVAEPQFPTEAEADASLGLTVTGAYCRIEVPSCSKYPWLQKTIYETPATMYGTDVPLLRLGAGNVAESCRLRAVEYVRFCGNSGGTTVTSRYVDASGAVIKQKTGDNGKVALYTIQGVCKPIGSAVNQVDYEDTWGEGFGDPEHDLAQAQQRFKDFVSWCGVPAKDVFLAYKVIHNGKLVLHMKNR